MDIYVQILLKRFRVEKKIFGNYQNEMLFKDIGLYDISQGESREREDKSQ